MGYRLRRVDRDHGRDDCCLDSGLFEHRWHLKSSSTDRARKENPWARGGKVDDDPAVRWEECARNLVAAHRSGSYIDIGSDQYKSYIRGRLLASSDPDAARLLSELDRRFRLT
jgi:hypothetical protein